MTLPIPSGTRDVLPDEMRERDGVLDALRRTYRDHGYGEVSTPAVEYASVLERAGVDPDGAARPRFHTVDERGQTLVLRSDMTVPIARLVGSRFADAPTPIRLSYTANCYRGVTPGRGDAREVLQSGIELCGAPAPAGTVEALTVLVAALRAVGLDGGRVAVGDAAFFPGLLEGLDVAPDARDRVLHELATRDHVGLRRELDAALAPDVAARLAEVAGRRGGPEIVAETGDAQIDRAAAGLRELVAGLAPDVVDHVILDLGLTRRLGYYTGAVFEVFAPGIGHPIGGGGRYDDLLGRLGRDLPAVGFALDVDAVHTALVGTARGSWRQVGWDAPPGQPAPIPGEDA
ncbi:MAG: ATP phosphoribosyltransferase regulatory subunit [Solirubrobacteraceae bacterium]|nr:ATP phosphoribosyltransferase regulatory subunit [Solirubrobacteraceae bacterium]